MARKEATCEDDGVCLDPPQQTWVERLLPHDVSHSEYILQKVIFAFLCFIVLLAVGRATYSLTVTKTQTLKMAGETLELLGQTALTNLTLFQRAKPDWSLHAGQEDFRIWLTESIPPGFQSEGRIYILTDRNGIIRATLPSQDFAVGDDIFSIVNPSKLHSLSSKFGTVFQIILENGRKYLMTFRILPGQGMFIITQNQNMVLASWQSRILFDLGFCLMAALGFLLIAFAVRSFSRSEQRALRRLQQQIGNNARQLENALVGARSGLWTWNIAEDRLNWSTSMFSLLGQEPRKTPLSLFELESYVHPDDKLIESIQECLDDGRSSLETSFRMRTRTGRWIWLRMNGTFVEFADSDFPVLRAVVYDVSEQKALEEKDDAVNRRLLDAIETISEAFVLWDQDKRLVICNHKFQAFHRLSDELVQPGTPYSQLVATDSDPVFAKGLMSDKIYKSGASTFEAQLANGRWLHINERRTAEGGYVSVGTDITALKKIQHRLSQRERELKATVSDLRQSRHKHEQQAQQLVELAEKYMREKTRAEDANRSKSEFLANISHELRTPLNAIIGFSEIMEQGLFGPIGNKKYEEYARDICQSGTYLLDVISDILDMSKIEAGCVNLNITGLHLGEIVTDCLRIVSQSAKTENITLERSGLDNIEMEADPRALKQVLINLLANAVKFTLKGGTVTIRMSKYRGQARIAISDTGIGISKKDIEKLGRPFEQVENQFTKSHKGSGLGLAISRSLIELHGGQLIIKSKEGEGTTVICRLPLEHNKSAKNNEEAVAQKENTETVTASVAA